METMSINQKSLIERDMECIWHPFTQMKTAKPPIPIVKAKGLYLYSDVGTRYIDGISSWWVNLHGHAHPYIAEKIKAQANVLEHVIFADFTHAPAVDLAERLLSLLPGNLSKVFYSDNGSTAVEAALKIALQYFYNQDSNTKKNKIICFKNSYHGDTFGAMSAAGKNVFNQPFWNKLFEVESINVPLDGMEEESFKEMRNILINNDVAAFIFEPLVQGAGGMVMYPQENLNTLLQMCKEYKVLAIGDEVMTGFGRTGSLFACDELKIKPDIICLSKGITGGFLPLGATLCTKDIYKAFLSDSKTHAFLHGHSYTANPIACASALASLDLLLQDSCAKKRKMIELSHETFCIKWKSHPKLKRCEFKGTILALEYKTNANASYFEPFRDQLYHFFLNQGILLRPLGNVLYVLPPYCIENHELEFIYSQIARTLEENLWI
jgi:adenosylmethionine-8-amino-7-oxononanoate aminotransferase